MVHKFNDFLNEKIKEQEEYYTTSRTMNIDKFIDTEVYERDNYRLSEVKKWIKKYNITRRTDLIWVATEPWIAARYQMLADDWENAKQIYNENKDYYDIKVVKSSEGTIIKESDDGDDGFLFIYK